MHVEMIRAVVRIYDHIVAKAQFDILDENNAGDADKPGVAADGYVPSTEQTPFYDSVENAKPKSSKETGQLTSSHGVVAFEPRISTALALCRVAPMQATQRADRFWIPIMRPRDKSRMQKQSTSRLATMIRLPVIEARVP